MEMVGAQACPMENMVYLEKTQLVRVQDVIGGISNGPNAVKHVGVEDAEELEDSTEGPIAGGNAQCGARVIHRHANSQ